MAESGPDIARIPGDPDADRHWLEAAIELSRRCPPSSTAFSVGAILADSNGLVISTGYSREVDPRDHAEEIALARAACTGTDLGGATLYASLEPCIKRASRQISCAELIARAGIRRVVIAWREPPVFVAGGGAGWLAARDIAVTEISDLADDARAVNAMLLG